MASRTCRTCGYAYDTRAKSCPLGHEQKAEPDTIVQTIDIDAIRRRMLQRANDAVPPRIKAMTVDQCCAEIKRILARPGLFASVGMREPGEEG